MHGPTEAGAVHLDLTAPDRGARRVVAWWRSGALSCLPFVETLVLAVFVMAASVFLASEGAARAETVAVGTTLKAHPVHYWP